MQQGQGLTIWDRLDYVPAFLAIIGTALVAMITGLFRGPSGADTYYHHIIHAAIRKFNSRLNIIQAQHVEPSLDKAYEKWCKEHHRTPDFVTTKTGLQGFWVGSRTADYVVVYYHGGGFAISGSPGHLAFWNSIQTHLSGAVSFFYVLYTLTPYASYPHQFQQSLDAIRHLLDDQHRSPSSLILAGDSAGGNLALSVLSHASRPSPHAAPLHVSKPFKGLLLMCPWVSFAFYPSFTRNQKKDYIEYATEKRWSDLYTKPHARSAYTEPASADAEWWRDSPVEQVLITSGADECLLDGIDEFVQKFRVHNESKTKYVIARNEVHIAPIVWPMLGDRHRTQSGEAIEKWMEEVVKSPPRVNLRGS